MPTLRERIAAVPFAKPAYRSLVQSVRRSGVPAVLREITGRRHVILAFHRVRAAGKPADPFDTCGSVSVEYFREILDCVRDRYAVVSLAGLYDARQAKNPLAAITFDDGWRDNYDVAFPLLRELGVPATIFIVTGKLGSSEAFWQEDLGHLFRAASEAPRGDAANGLRSLLRVRDGRPLTCQLYRDTVVRWKNLTQAECFGRLRRAGWAASQDAARPRQFLKADEIREMAANGVSFGSHGVTHRILPRYGRAEVERELRESKAALETLFGHAIDTLAYPDGQHSEVVVECAASCGYRLAVTTRFSRLSLHDDPLRLPRLDAAAENLLRLL